MIQNDENLGNYYEVESRFTIFDVSEIVARYESILDTLSNQVDTLEEKNRVLEEKLTKLNNLQAKFSKTPLAWLAKKLL